MGRWVRARRDDRGAAAVEFALILPVLLLLVFGIMDYGDMLSVRQSVSQSAAEGARAAAVTQGTDAQKIDAAKDAVTSTLRAQGQTCTSWSTTAASGRCSVTLATCTNTSITPAPRCATVEVYISYRALIPGFGLVLPNTLHYSAVARVS